MHFASCFAHRLTHLTQHTLLHTISTYTHTGARTTYENNNTANSAAGEENTHTHTAAALRTTAAALASEDKEQPFPIWKKLALLAAGKIADSGQSAPDF